ncbi:hypothetical protein P0Y35_08940 [Kiritimatiellaeota bacterium B1221]|nr:hypothetical protein [Kiritimatiellaeota bacterium B1221]
MKFPRICFRSLGLKLLAFSPALMVWVAVWSIGVSLLPERLERVRNNYDIGHADTAAYAWQGRQLARGKGWVVPYVTNYLYRYDPDQPRGDDQWGPLLSFVLAPVFFFGEDTAATARMTTVWIGTVLLPFAMCLLVQGITLRAWPGLLAALPIWFSMELFAQSTQVFNDQLVTAVLAMFLGALLASRRYTWLMEFCGPLMALAWYGKGSQLMLIPFFFIAVLLIHGPRGWIHRSFLGTLLLALLMMFPRLRENAVTQGNPLHSTQKVVSSYFGLKGAGWDPGFYSIYWGRDLPGLENRFAHPGLHMQSMEKNTEFFLRYFLLGLEAKKESWGESMGEGVARMAEDLRRGQKTPSQIFSDFPVSDLKLPFYSKMILLGLFWGLLGLFTMPGDWFYTLLSKRTFPLENQRGAAAILVAFVLIQAVFLILFWNSILRLYYPSLLISQTLLWTLLPLRFGKKAFPVWASPLLTALFVVAVSVHFNQALPELKNKQTAHFRRPPPAKPHYPRVQRLAKPLAEHLPADAVIMARNPWEILWYAPEGLKGVGMPYARPEDLFAVAKYYKVTHLILDKERPGLRAFIQNHASAFSEVFQKPYRCYEIHWQEWDTEWISPLQDLKPLWDPRKGFEHREKQLQKRLKEKDHG